MLISSRHQSNPRQCRPRPNAGSVTALTVAAALVAGAALVATPAGAATPPATGTVQYTGQSSVARGVTYRSFTYTGTGGTSQGHLLHADLDTAGVRMDLLHPSTVAESATVSAMARNQGALGGVNADFFNISDPHPGVTPTNSSDGVEITVGRDLKASVPDGQRFGPALIRGLHGDSAFGVGTDGKARIGSIDLAGTARVGRRVMPIKGLNQYALRQGGIGEYTTAWGSGSLLRPTCGSNRSAADPCSTNVAEVVVRRGVITQVRRTIADRAVQPGTTVLIGREAGADKLAKLRVGQRIALSTQLVAAKGPQYRFAVGVSPILRGGATIRGADTKALAPRTAVGISRDGHQVDLVVVDGRSEASAGVTIAELAEMLRTLGDASGANMDGGGSSELVSRDRKTQRTVIKNVPSDGTERSVANGVGIFLGRG